jgi:hypothetical protein
MHISSRETPAVRAATSLNRDGSSTWRGLASRGDVIAATSATLTSYPRLFPPLLPRMLALDRKMPV